MVHVAKGSCKLSTVLRTVVLPVVTRYSSLGDYTEKTRQQRGIKTPLWRRALFATPCQQLQPITSSPTQHPLRITARLWHREDERWSHWYMNSALPFERISGNPWITTIKGICHPQSDNYLWSTSVSIKRESWLRESDFDEQKNDEVMQDAHQLQHENVASDKTWNSADNERSWDVN